MHFFLQTLHTNWFILLSFFLLFFVNNECNSIENLKTKIEDDKRQQTINENVIECVTQDFQLNWNAMPSLHYG